MAWSKLESTTLTTSGSNVTSGTITASNFLQVMSLNERTGANDMRFTFNNDTGNNYANRKSSDGGADGTLTSQPNNAYLTLSGARPSFLNMFIVNISSEEKLCIYNVIHNGTAGAGTAPQRQEWVGKWVNTSSQITEIDISPDGGNLNTNSNITVLGTD